MKRCLRIALALLATAACGGGSGAPSGSGTPLSVGDNDPAPPSRDNPGSSSESPGGQSSGSSSSGGPAGCPCAGTYSCGAMGVDGGSTSISISASGGTCFWSTAAGGASLVLGCNGMTTYQGYQYTSSWSGSTIQLCATSQQSQAACITCNGAATPGSG